LGTIRLITKSLQRFFIKNKEEMRKFLFHLFHFFKNFQVSGRTETVDT